VGSRLRVSQVLLEVLPLEPERLLALSGPNHAEEVARGIPSATVLAGGDPGLRRQVQELLTDQRLRVYTSDDLVGVELGGALKNVIALGCGISDGLGFGENTRAALITRGLAEMTRLGLRLGAHPLTFSGLSGLGDLVATATSLHSRNLRAGRAIGAGRSPAEVLRTSPMVIEGAPTAHAAVELGEALGVELPIATAVHQVLAGRITPPGGGGPAHGPRPPGGAGDPGPARPRPGLTGPGSRRPSPVFLKRSNGNSHPPGLGETPSPINLYRCARCGGRGAGCGALGREGGRRMDRFDIFQDISRRTHGSVYLGVVGPVRTGKSTFIKRFRT